MNATYTWNGRALGDLSREELIAALQISMAAQDAMIREGIRVHQVQGESVFMPAKKSSIQ